MTTFKNYYRFHLKIDEIGNDSILGRYNREFDKCQPTMFALLRAKDLSTSQRQIPIKRTKLLSTTELHETGVDDHDVVIVEVKPLIFRFLDAMELVANTWLAKLLLVDRTCRVRRRRHWEKSLR